MLRKGHVVIVESDDLIRQLLESWLGEAGYVVAARAASEPRDPSSFEPAADPDLVIVNVPDPRVADSLIQALKSEYLAPVLVVSARFRHGLGGSVEAARRLGACKVLPKPFTREELLAAVEESIAGSREDL